MQEIKPETAVHDKKILPFLFQICQAIGTATKLAFQALMVHFFSLWEILLQFVFLLKVVWLVLLYFKMTDVWRDTSDSQKLNVLLAHEVSFYAKNIKFLATNVKRMCIIGMSNERTN